MFQIFSLVNYLNLELNLVIALSLPIITNIEHTFLNLFFIFCYGDTISKLGLFYGFLKLKAIFESQ